MCRVIHFIVGVLTVDREYQDAFLDAYKVHVIVFCSWAGQTGRDIHSLT